MQSLKSTTAPPHAVQLSQGRATCNPSREAPRPTPGLLGARALYPPLSSPLQTSTGLTKIGYPNISWGNIYIFIVILLLFDGMPNISDKPMCWMTSQMLNALLRRPMAWQQGLFSDSAKGGTDRGRRGSRRVIQALLFCVLKMMGWSWMICQRNAFDILSLCFWNNLGSKPISRPWKPNDP